MGPFVLGTPPVGSLRLCTSGLEMPIWTSSVPNKLQCELQSASSSFTLHCSGEHATKEEFVPGIDLADLLPIAASPEAIGGE